MNILVTGASGFIGSHLCRELVARGHTVRAFHRASSNLLLLEDLPVEHAIGDLTQPDTLGAAMESIEVVFHTAAWIGGSEQPGRVYAVTVEGTRSVLQAAWQTGVRRVVYTSSAAALGVPEDIPHVRRGFTAEPALLNENHTWNYRQDYYPDGYAKYLAEQEVQKAVAQGLDVVILNPTLVFGAGDAHRQSTSIITQVAGLRVSVAVEGGINCVHIDDVVEGHLAAMEYGQTGQRYLLGGENLVYLELLQMIAEVAGVDSPNLVLPTRLVRSLAGPARTFKAFLNLPVSPELLHMAGYYFFYDYQKAARELHLPEPRPVREAIRQAYAWFMTGSTGAKTPV